MMAGENENKVDDAQIGMMEDLFNLPQTSDAPDGDAPSQDPELVAQPGEGDNSAGTTEEPTAPGAPPPPQPGGEAAAPQALVSDVDPTRVDVDPRDAIIAQLRAEIMALAGNQQRYPQAPSAPTNPSNQPNQPQISAPTQTQTQPQLQQDSNEPRNYLSKEELDEIIDKPELINVAIHRATQDVLKTAQSVVASEVNRQVTLMKAVQEFYDQNSDLTPYSQFVGYILSETERNNQDKTYREIFQLAAEESRKKLGLPTPVQVNTQGGRLRQAPEAQQRPAMAGSKRSGGRGVQDSIFDENARDLFNL